MLFQYVWLYLSSNVHDKPAYVRFNPAFNPWGGSFVNLTDICNKVIGNKWCTSVVIHRRKESSTVSLSIKASINSSMNGKQRWQFWSNTHPPFKIIKICDALRVLVSYVQFLKNDKHPWRSVTFSKVVHGCFSYFLNCKNYTKSFSYHFQEMLLPANSFLKRKKEQEFLL